MTDSFLGMKLKFSIIKSMVEIKHWSIGCLNVFGSQLKSFWAMPKKIGHQLLVAKVGDRIFFQLLSC
jgi:hypothetical protein